MRLKLPRSKFCITCKCTIHANRHSSHPHTDTVHCAGSSVEERGEEENGEGEDDVGGRPREDSQVGGELVVWWVWSHHGNMFPVATRTQETDAEAAQPESEVGQDEDEVKLLQLTFIVQYSPTIIIAET